MKFIIVVIVAILILTWCMHVRIYNAWSTNLFY